MAETAGQLLLVDENDQIIGHGEKLMVHQRGLLHRAFSIVVFNDAGEMLLQQRALCKYHCGGLWTNTCCSHPLSGETVDDAVHARLQLEMGFDCPLTHHHTLTYRAAFAETGLVEHEIDHVYTGRFDGIAQANPDEVMAHRWVGMGELRRDIRQNPSAFTPWLRLILELL